MAEKAYMTVINENNEIMDVDVLFIFNNTATGKSYIVYTENTTDENGDTEVFASAYDPDERPLALHPIETEEEWAVLESKLREYERRSGGEDTAS